MSVSLPLKHCTRWGTHSLRILLLAIGMATGAFAANEKELYVSTLTAPVYATASGYSQVVGTLEYGAQVQVTARVQEQESAGKLPGWVQIKSGDIAGFLPASCLVSKRLLARQSNITEEDVAKANRKFSEEEKGDLTVMKGMGGSASGGDANFAAVDKILAEQDKAAENKQQQGEFRKAGKLGEYKE